MDNLYDYKRYAILYVDDEKRSLESFTDALEDRFSIFTAPNAEKGYKLLQEHQDEIGILISDQRMPGEKGAELLARARKLCPGILRILVTAYTDLDATIDAINTGAIYKYVTKPWHIPTLEITLMRGLEFFMLQKDRDQLAAERMSILHRMMIADRVLAFSLITSGIQHHIRNAMTAIRTFIELTPQKLKEEDLDIDHLKDPDFWRTFHQRAEQQVGKIANLFTDIGAVIDEPVSRFTDHIQLHEAVTDVIKTLKRDFDEHKMQVENNVPDNLPVLTVDKSKFYQIFELLLKDEIICMPEGARIVINARFSEKKINGKPCIHIEIQDNGPALPADALRSVFDPFFAHTGNPSEFGLYLMASFFMVYHHGGDMEVISDPKKGNTFIIRIPTEPPQASSQKIRHEFLSEILLNDTLWERLLSEPG
ncbi:MAG: response regulator [Candidatus Anammoxibacter sp.]